MGMRSTPTTSGRLASLIAYDFTVMAGSMGRNAETKCNRAREIAYTKRIPMIWLIDSAGARIQEAIGSRWSPVPASSSASSRSSPAWCPRWPP
jgi:acetyl-CoA carboxylase carboxyltransferase component